MHPQKQEGLFWGCACVPAGRIHAQDFYDFARVADECGPQPPQAPLDVRALEAATQDA